MQKKKRMEHVSFVLAVDGILVFIFTFKETFLLSYFSVTKSTKSQQGGLAPSSFRTTGGVHEFVARAMHGKCVRQIAKRKSVVLPLSAVSAIPRVRTYHTRKPSRFVHALSARPLKVQGGRGEVCTLTKSGHFASLLQWGIDRFAQANAVGVAETGAEGGPR